MNESAWIGGTDEPGDFDLAVQSGRTEHSGLRYIINAIDRSTHAWYP